MPWTRVNRPCLLAVAQLLMAGAVPLPAQQSAQQTAEPPAPITLVDAVRRAGTVAPAALAAAGRRAEIVGRARTDAQWTNPTLELRRENLASPLPYDDFATLTLPVDLTGRRFALRAALGASRERALADSLVTIRGAEFATARAWWSAWAAQALATIATEQAELHARVARVDSLRAAEGELSEAAAFRMLIEAQRARHGAALAASGAAHARAELAALVGEGDPAQLLVEGEVPTLAPLPAVESALAAALRDRPDLMAARATERAAERRRVAESRAVLPDVGLTGGYKGTGGLSTSVVGLLVSAPLLNLNGGNRERSAGEWLIATADRRATELRVSTEVRAALEAAAALDAGTAGFDATFVTRATVVAEAAETAYREGAASLVELLDAFRAAADARAALVRGTLDRALARLDLRRAMGAPAVEVP